MNINRVVLTGNLTKDPDVRNNPASGLSVCKLRLAVNTRRKNNATGDWEDKANYFNVTVFGRQAESCGQLPAARGARWRSTAGSSGASTRLTDRSASPSISSLRTCSSSAVATTLGTETGTATPAAHPCGGERHPGRYQRLRNDFRGCRDRPTTTSRSEEINEG